MLICSNCLYLQNPTRLERLIFLDKYCPRCNAKASWIEFSDEITPLVITLISKNYCDFSSDFNEKRSSEFEIKFAPQVQKEFFSSLPQGFAFKEKTYNNDLRIVRSLRSHWPSSYFFKRERWLAISDALLWAERLPQVHIIKVNFYSKDETTACNIENILKERYHFTKVRIVNKAANNIEVIGSKLNIGRDPLLKAGLISLAKLHHCFVEFNYKGNTANSVNPALI